MFEYDSLQLFNIKEDIGEQYNLAFSHPEKVEELYRELKNWRTEVDAQMPIKNPDYDLEKEETWGSSKSTAPTEGGKKEGKEDSELIYKCKGLT